MPAYFNDAQRQATKDAGRIAGLEVLRIINEPTAAALAYGLDKKGNETVLVFDLGGGTFDVSILDVGDGVVEVRSTAGDTHLGGDDFDRRIVDYLADEFQRDDGIDLRRDPQALQRLFEAAEKAKVELSLGHPDADQPAVHHRGRLRPQAPEHHAHAVHVRGDHRRSRRAAPGPVQQAMADAKITADDIDEVILVGGSTRIPAVQDLVRRLTGGKDPNMTVNPDEVVALGAAIQAAVLKGEVKDVLLLDVTPLSLGHRDARRDHDQGHRAEHHDSGPPHRDVQHRGGQPDRRGRRGAAGRARARRRQPGPRRFRLENIRPAPRGVPQVEVTFDIDANGILNVSAKDKDTGAEQRITISESSTLDQSEVERMVADAERHRDEDQRLRQLSTRATSSTAPPTRSNAVWRAG